jgi:tetratricopeptide (TPR) repeat protein
MKKHIFGFILITFIFSCTGKSQENSKIGYNPDAIELNNKAAEFVIKNKTDKALELYDKAIKLDKSNYFPHIGKANIYISENNYNKALYELEEAIKKKQDLAEFIFFVGVLYEEKGNVEKAKELYLKSIRIFDERIKNPDKNKERDVNILNRALAKKFLNDKTYIDDLKLIKNLNVSSASIKMVKDLTKEEIIGQLVP